MDPVTIQSASLAAQRPAIALQGDLSAVLQEGRVLAGEVLQSFDGRSLLIGVGRHRVPAESQVELPVGHRFLFQVERDGDGFVLRVLDNADLHEPALLAALRKAVGHQAPLAQELSALANLLRGVAGAEELLARLESLLSNPARNGEVLASRLASTGLRHESRLAVPAMMELPRSRAVALGRELEAWLGGRLVDGLGRAGSSVTATGLLSELSQELARSLGVQLGSPEAEQVFARMLGQGEPHPQGTLEDLARLLREVLGRVLEGPARGRALANMASANLAGLGRGLAAVLLRRLLGLPAQAPADTRAAELAAAEGNARVDLKSLLLQVLGRLGEGVEPALAESLGRALAGLESDQLLNVARSQAGEPLQLWLPFPDGSGWTTLRFQARHRHDGEGGEEQRGGEGVWRFELALELSRTGPLRADLVARTDALFVGLRVSSEELVQEFEGRGEELLEILRAHFERVDLRVRCVDPQELREGRVPTNVRYLHERRLMDLSA